MAITITITEKAPATGLVASLAAGGSLVVGTTYYYKLVAVEMSATAVRCNNATAVSAPTAEVSFTPTSGNQSIKLDWVAPAKINGVHFNSYLIFRTTVAGDYSTSVAHLISAGAGDSGNATTIADVVTYTDTGARTLNLGAIYPLGVPKVVVDTTAGSVVTEEVLYQAYVSAGKTQFASKTSNPRGLGLQYYFTGMFLIGYGAGGCVFKIQPGRDVVIDGMADFALSTNMVVSIGSSSTPGGSSLGMIGFAGDLPFSLRGVLNLYNSKFYDAGHLLGVVTGGYFYAANAFNGFKANAASVVKNCQVLSYNGNTTLAGPIAVSGTLLELSPRHEPSAGQVPLITDATIYGGFLYTYSARYVINKRCTLISGLYNDFSFNGASAVERRYFDLIDFTPTNEPPKGSAITNPAAAIYQRKWSLNVKATDAADAPLQNVAVGVVDKNGATSVFVDSGTKTNTAFYGAAATAITVLDGTKVAVNDVIRIAAELMLVAGIAGNVLTVTRGYAGSYANDYGTQHSFTVWLRKDVAKSSALGVVEEQYLTQCTYQGNPSNALPYQYDTVTYTPHVITISKYGYQRVTLTQTVAAPIKIAQRMLADAHITATEATAGAYTGIAIDQPLGTITITEAHTLDELYDYVQWWASRDANLKHAIPLTTSDGITYSLDYDLVIDGCTLTGIGNIAMPSNALTLLSSGSSTAGITHAAGALTTISVTGYAVGARLQVYDTVDAVEIYNDIPAGATLTLVQGWSADHLLRIRMARVVGVDADLPIQTFAVFSQAGAQVLLTPSPDTVYEANGIDGDTATEFTADFPNVQIDVSDPDGVTTPQRGYAWYMAGQMTAPGIANFHGGMSADDSLNYRINASVLDMRVQNVSALPCVIAGARLYRDDGSSIFATGVGPIQSEPSKAYVASGASAASVASAVRTELAVELARVDADVSSRLADADYTAPDNAGIAAIPTTPDARLDNLDAAISTRLAAAAYTAPGASITPSDVWSHATRTITSGGITLAQIEASSVLAKESTVISRLAAATYAAPLDATATQAAAAAALATYGVSTGADVVAIQSAIALKPSAAAVRAEIDLNSAKLDVAVSSRLAAAGYTAPDNAGIAAVSAKLPSAGAKMAGEGASAKNLDQVTVDISGLATTASIAALPAAVRTNLATELARVDASISSRLAAAAYTPPASAEDTADAVWAKELP